MTKQELVEKLKLCEVAAQEEDRDSGLAAACSLGIGGSNWADCESIHRHADGLLLKFIGDPEVTEAFEDIPRWYS